MCHAVQRNDKRGKFLFTNVLKFVDEHCESGIRFSGGLPGNFEERLKIVFKIAVVGQSGFWLKVEPDLYIVVPNFQCLGEASQSTERALRKLFCFFHVG